MNAEILLKSDDAVIQRLNFKPYRSTVERRVERFLPAPDEAQTMQLETPWGETLTAKAGDYLVRELHSPPEDCWAVKADIFQETYIEPRPGYCLKRALTELVPLVDAVGGNPDIVVTSLTMGGIAPCPLWAGRAL